MTVTRFEDLTAWKRARSMTTAVYEASKKGSISADFGFRNQLRRAAISVMNNVAEGFGRRGDKEFSSFLRIAKGSTSEVKSMLYIGLDLGYFSEEEFESLFRKAAETEAVISGLIAYLANKKRDSRTQLGTEGEPTSTSTFDFRLSTRTDREAN